MSISKAFKPSVTFRGFAGGPSQPSELRQRITQAYRQDEPEAVERLLPQARMPDGMARDARALALRMRIPVFERLLLKTSLSRPLKDLPTREEKMHALAGTFTLHDEIRNQGLWNALLIDDLYDSGATMEVASLLLRKYRKVNHLYVAALTWK